MRAWVGAKARSARSPRALPLARRSPARARELGARDVRVVPSGVAIPDEVGEPDEPPHVLFVGRLSEEKGILELLAATEGMPRVIVGDGPLRDRVPDAVGFVPPRELGAYYERAAVVVCPSRREGYGVVAREAMAHGAPGGRDRRRRSPRRGRGRRDGPSRSPARPGGAAGRDREALGDGELRRALGASGREAARERFSWKAATEATIGAYRDALT